MATARWVRRAPTPPSPTTRAACSRWAAARSSSTDPTGSGAATAWRSSYPATRRRRGCWCSARSTSPPRWRGRARSSATGSPCATPARCSRPGRVSRPPTTSSSTGPTATWPPRPRRAPSIASTVICVLTHDPKFDVPLLEVALRLSEVGYVGAMGSRRTHDDRMTRLRSRRADRGRAEPAVQPDRARPRRTHPGGDRGVDRRRDHRPRWGGGGRPLAGSSGGSTTTRRWKAAPRLVQGSLNSLLTPLSGRTG